MKKIVNEHGHILMLSHSAGVEITDEEAAAILAELEHIPKNAPSGFTYRLRDDTHEWELYELPPIEEETEATEADYIAALNEMGVEV